MTTILMQTTDLSPREQEVARLYSKGVSARYVAERLHISPRTVEVHIRHIYEKLGISRRDELIERYGRV